MTRATFNTKHVVRDAVRRTLRSNGTNRGETNDFEVEPLPFAPFEDIKAATEGDEFVEELLSKMAMSIIYGASGTGKTFFVLDLALSIATGRAWRDRAVDQGGVLYLALEGSRGIRNRIAAIKQKMERQSQDLPFALITVSVDLLDPNADTAALIETVKLVAARFEISVTLVVIDTLSRAIAGGNENDSIDMGALVRNGDRLRQATGAHVMWVHHSGKDDSRGARGHSLLRAATDTEIELTVQGTTHVARVKKQRDFLCSGEFVFTLQPVELGKDRRGKIVRSCVVEHVLDVPVASVLGTLTGHRKRAYDVLLDLLNASGESGRDDVPYGIRSVPARSWRNHFYGRAMPDAEEEAKKKAFDRASRFLVESHRVGVANGRVWVPTDAPTDSNAG